MLTFDPVYVAVASVIIIYLSLGMLTVTWVLRRKRNNILSRNRLVTVAILFWPFCLYIGLKELKWTNRR